MELNDHERLILSLSLQAQIMVAQALLSKLNPPSVSPAQEQQPAEHGGR